MNREIRPQSGKPHPCPHCHKRFRKVSDVAQHVKAAHAKEQANG